MKKVEEYNRGYPQSDPDAQYPPKSISNLAILVMLLGLIAVVVILLPAVVIMSIN